MKRGKHVLSLLKELTGLVESQITICADPMNGCPGDFSAAYQKKIDTLITRLECLNVDAELIGKAVATGEKLGNKAAEKMYK